MEKPMGVVAPNDQPADLRDAGGAAFRTFFRIAELWKLSADEQMTLLGLTSRSTYYKWRNEPPRRLTPDLLERLSYIFGIYRALQVLLPEPGAADAWIRRPNTAPPFHGRSALDRLLSGHVADLYVVRKYLDAERGGWS
jgi:hypothetical protein